MATAVVPVLVCRCGAAMTGAPQSGHSWVCGKNHAFRVTAAPAAGAEVRAVAVRGDRSAGIDDKRNYIWRTAAGTPEIRPTPL